MFNLSNGNFDKFLTRALMVVDVECRHFDQLT